MAQVLQRLGFFIGVAALIWVAFQSGFNPFDQPTKVAGTTAQNNVVTVRSDDPEISEAKQTAASTLAVFMQRAENPSQTWEMANLKVALEGETMIENIWITDFVKSGADQFKGRLGNDPVDLPGMKAGDEVTFAESQIVDWAFVEDGKGYGFYSVRALLPGMDEEQAAGIRAFLSPEPLPEGW